MVLLSAFLSDFGAKIQGLWAWPPSPAEPLGGLVMVLWQLLASKKALTALHRTWTAQSTKQQGIYTARRQRFSNRTAGGHLQKVWSLGVTRTLKVRTVSGIRLEAGDPENPKTSKHQIWLARCLFFYGHNLGCPIFMDKPSSRTVLSWICCRATAALFHHLPCSTGQHQTWKTTRQNKTIRFFHENLEIGLRSHSVSHLAYNIL